MNSQVFQANYKKSGKYNSDSRFNANVAKSSLSAHAGQELVVVKDWFDSSDKYGLGFYLTPGYLLSSGQLGVYFNDLTNLLILKDKFFNLIRKLMYVESNQNDHKI